MPGARHRRGIDTQGERLTDIGTVLGGRYRLVELLGQGGMATIYRARDNQLERDVAIKVLRPEYGADPDFIDRFRHEAQSAASLNHPSVVAVYDYGTDPVGPFIVMELVEGEDLSAIIRRSGALPPRAAARLVAQAARAIAAAHDRGFVHRDVKPGNVLVTREGRVKVADFGIARALSESALTLPGTTLGSVHYFSPEQARGELATPASDIYSLGIVLFELLTGRRPWTGDTAAAIATARLTGAVPSPSAVRGGISPTLEAITHKALATNASGRYASAADMAEALEAYLGEERAGDDAGSRGAAAGAAGGAAGAAGAAGLAAGAAGAAGSIGGSATGAAAAAGAAGAAAGADAGAAAAGASPTVAAGVARPNPGARIQYPSDAYAGGRPGGGSRRPADPRAAAGEDVDDDGYDDEPKSRGTSPWLWLSGLLALGVLALAAFLVIRLTGGPGESPAPQVEVPDLFGKTFADAELVAEDLGFALLQASFTPAASGIAAGTIASQDPLAGTLADEGSTIEVTVATTPGNVIMPDLRFKTRSEAINLIFAEGLSLGVETEEFDPVVAEGQIVSHFPAFGASVPRGTPVDFVLSKGPEPTATPAPTPTPPPPPTPTPVPPPTPEPDLTVDDYRCQLLALARADIVNDGFEVGDITGPTDDASWVIWQEPQPDSEEPSGTEIDLWTVDQPAPTTCPQEPT